MIRRLYHISAVTFNVRKQGFKLCKLVNPKNKKQWYPSQPELNTMPSLKSLTKTQKEPGKRGYRRIAMLNKLFMKHITDLMSTGTVSMDIIGRGIEISKVQITEDFQTLNVFWVCKGNSTDEELEALLNKTGGALRYELSNLRVMGEVPYIVFVKDRQESLLVDLDHRLSIADYGEDFAPTEMGHIMKTEFVLNTKLSPEMMVKIKQLEDQLSETEEPIPEMTHNVYGLDHEKIMNRLVATRKKTKDAWRSLDQDSSVLSYRTPDDVQPSTDIKKQKQELAEFLLQRQILQKQLQKQMRKSNDDWQLTAFAEKEVDDDVIYDDDEYYTDEDDDDDYCEALEAHTQKDSHTNNV